MDKKIKSFATVFGGLDDKNYATTYKRIFDQQKEGFQIYKFDTFNLKVGHIDTGFTYLPSLICVLAKYEEENICDNCTHKYDTWHELEAGVISPCYNCKHSQHAVNNFTEIDVNKEIKRLKQEMMDLIEIHGRNHDLVIAKSQELDKYILKTIK